MTERVEIFEVGPRDGLQNEARDIPVSEKVALVDCLSRAGFSRIEVASFVSPKWVPQMAGSGEVLAGITKAKGVRYAALTPNLRGYEDALGARADEIAIFAAASEGFSKANLNATIAESLERFAPILEAARHIDLPVRGYVSCVTDCPFDGAVVPEQVAKVADQLFGMGCYEISLGDTIGQGTPDSIAKMLLAVKDHVPVTRIAGHYHNTAGRAIDNIDASLALGVRVFDAAVGGLGGCPYAPGAAGNVATEAVEAHLGRLGYETGSGCRRSGRGCGHGKGHAVLTRGVGVAVLICFSGLPAVGKSTVARLLSAKTGAIWLRLDEIEAAMRLSHMKYEDLADGGYAAAQVMAKSALAQGHSVIADCVNPIALTRAGWHAASHAVGAAHLDVELTCSDTQLHRVRAETRDTDLEGVAMPGWDVICLREYEPFETADLRLDTCALSPEAAVQASLEFLETL